MKEEKGITLVALVVTIIILIILAGISIRLVLGDNGIVTRAKEAKIEYEIAQIKEEIGIDIAKEQAENEGTISDERLESILLEYGALTKEENIKDRTLTTKRGNYQIRVSEIFDGATVNTPFAKGANAPNISGFDKTKTYYVTWNLNGEKTEYIIDEKKISENAAPSNWYDYTEGVNQWANVKTTGGGNDCYWVWIPRYAYKITYTTPESRVSGNIDVKFLKGTSNVPIGETEEIVSKTPGHEKWLVHPAFWWDENNNGIEDEGEQLTGIWVAKFEASSNSPSVVENPTPAQLATDGGSATDIELKVRAKPNVTSWRSITMGSIVTVCKNLTTAGNSLENTTKIDSHLMKNIEWGAVAYLSKSSYGKNGKVWTNPYFNNISDCSPITGFCGIGVNDEDLHTTEIANACKYNEVKGGNASTTGNVYGVYDMSGGAYEFVAGILGSYKSNGGYYDFTNSDLYPNKYFDWYAGDSGDRNTNYNANGEKYGDAVYEICISGEGSNAGWDNIGCYFPTTGTPIFIRGGRAWGDGIMGVFHFSSNAGEGDATYSFRPALINER